MRKLIFLLWCIGIFALSIPADSFAKTTEGNPKKKECEEWCAEHKLNCDFCAPNRNCGAGYSRVAGFGDLNGAWTEPGRRWYACWGDQDSKKNQTECEQWCEANKGEPRYCAKCSPLTGCGQGYNVLKLFGGKGKNWHACGKTDFREASDANKADCEKWCEEHKADGCVLCDTNRNCGVGRESMKHFTGPGRNWHACRHKGSFKEDSDRLKAECTQWCDANKDRGCVRCDTQYGCGIGYEPMKHFTGHGKNWHACKKK